MNAPTQPEFPVVPVHWGVQDPALAPATKFAPTPQIQPELLGLAKAIPGATRGPLHLVLNRKPPAKPIRVGRQTEPVLQTRRAESERRPHATWSESNAVHSRPCGPRQAELEQAVQGGDPTAGSSMAVEPALLQPPLGNEPLLGPLLATVSAKRPQMRIPTNGP